MTFAEVLAQVRELLQSVKLQSLSRRLLYSVQLSINKV